MVQFPDPRSRHPYHMYDMIRAQPGFVEETLDRLADQDPAPFLDLPEQLIITGCGTSYHTAMYGARILSGAFGSSRTVEAAHAYDLAYGKAPPKRSVVLGVSHSGATPTTNRALARARRIGARTLGLIGLPDTKMERVCDATIVIGSTHDRSWANTMSYTTQLAAFASLASRLGGATLRMWVQSLPRTMRSTLRCEGPVRRLAARLARASRVTFLGAGWDEITAHEAALKIRETCSLSASAYHLEQFLHGPFLSLGARERVVMILSRGDAERAETIRRALNDASAGVTTVGDRPDASIRLPRTPESLRPIVSVIPMQFLAYYAALARNANPDIMRTNVARYRRGVEALFR